MATLFFPSLIFLLLLHAAATIAQTCKTTCGSNEISVHFPFRLKEANQSDRCGYDPSFDLTCENPSQLLLNLANAGDFVVKNISYEDQTLWINDPNNCLPKRFLHDMILKAKGSPFQLDAIYDVENYTFFNCPFNVTEMIQVPLGSIECLNTNTDDNSSVVALRIDPGFPAPSTSSCKLIGSASVPIAYDEPWLWTSYNNDIQLQWSKPNCINCESQGGRCGFLGETGRSITCYDLPIQDQGGLSRKAKYGISIGLGVPGLLCMMGLACFFCGKMKMQGPRRQANITEFSTLIIPHPHVVAMGLDGATIEKYPKTQLGESGRLPKPTDNTCSICLCEYQPKETIRSMPECNHYFHAHCIDGWLRMNATCPLCRNLPESPSSHLNSHHVTSPSDSYH